jgi:hypothetical protein
MVFLNRKARLATLNGPAPEKVSEVSVALRNRIVAAETGREFFNQIITNRSFRDDLPVNEVLDFVASHKDAATAELVISELDGEAGKSLSASDRAFAKLAFEAAVGSAPDEASWPQAIRSAFAKSETSKDPTAVMFWPTLLGALVTQAKMDPTVVMEVHRAAFDRAAKFRMENNGPSELLRAAWRLATLQLDANDPDACRETIRRTTDQLQSRPGKLGTNTLQIGIRLLERLQTASLGETTENLLATLNKDAENSATMKEAYAKFLQPPATDP